MDVASGVIQGIALCEGFFHETAEPLLAERFPSLAYAAGLIGYGSDVLGFDDAVSRDHMWGPRFYLFLRREDMAFKPEIEALFSERLPYTYRGFSVHFSKPDPKDHGVRHAEFRTQGQVSSLIEIHTLEDFAKEYLGRADFERLTERDWLAFSEHRLLGMTSGKIFRDDIGLEEMRAKIRFYPDDVKLYLIASNWSLIAEEQAFVKRCGMVGDDLGSRLIAGRIAERLMRLVFLYENRYAPYSKWFGTAFAGLSAGRGIGANIAAALSADGVEEREAHLVEAQRLTALLHNEKGLTDRVSAQVCSYFGRDIQVIYADRIAEAVKKELEGTVFARMPLIGTLSQVGGFACLADDPTYAERVRKIYEEADALQEPCKEPIRMAEQS